MERNIKRRKKFSKISTRMGGSVFIHKNQTATILLQSMQRKLCAVSIKNAKHSFTSKHKNHSKRIENKENVTVESFTDFTTVVRQAELRLV